MNFSEHGQSQLLTPATWDAAISDLAKTSVHLFHQGTPNDEQLAMLKKFRFAAIDPFQVYLLELESREFFYQDFVSEQSRDKAKSTVEFHIERFSPLGAAKPLAFLILEELLMNAFITSAGLAAEGKMSFKPRMCRVRVEWKGGSFWVHAIDPYGVVTRKNFQQIFRPGLRTTFERSNDLWIKSKPNWGTMVSARIALDPKSAGPKTFLADFD
jgi:hypothetical protein